MQVQHILLIFLQVSINNPGTDYPVRSDITFTCYAYGLSSVSRATDDVFVSWIYKRENLHGSIKGKIELPKLEPGAYAVGWYSSYTGALIKETIEVTGKKQFLKIPPVETDIALYVKKEKEQKTAPVFSIEPDLEVRFTLAINFFRYNAAPYWCDMPHQQSKLPKWLKNMASNYSFVCWCDSLYANKREVYDTIENYDFLKGPPNCKSYGSEQLDQAINQFIVFTDKLTKCLGDPDFQKVM